MEDIHVDDSLPFLHNAGDIVIQSGFVLGPRIIRDYELVYFPEGTHSIYKLGNLPFILDEPCFIFTRPDTIHTYHFAADKIVRHMFVHFDYAALRNAEPRFQLLLQDGNHFPALHQPLLPGIMKKILWIANHQPPYWKRRMAVLLAALLEELSSVSGHTPEETAPDLPIPIIRAIEYMEEHLSSPITIEEIAQRSGWSHEHFTRVFVASVGITPKRMLLERRLIRAEGMMMKGEITVKQIAFWVGFRDEHHFSKMYKRIRGMNPSDYIKRCKDTLFRHTAMISDPQTPYPVNRHILINTYIK
ncbi:AraC family transcriptional regulator [Paenibacillus psychroresistens]|uniref:AraC family transcriptional regulator n=1 Tax=Paenibacillus psychroresistens TaxID=1778678 RepID=A0A6B8RQS2_9BACL|nr:AraC family transcriptional regulator [Paenibacillus psychroresistens]QGQ98741.1 AraC family transcriptional regulator [Paenibacillus psychroresistens]